MYLHGCYIAAVLINQNNHQNTSTYVSCKQVIIPQYVSTHSWSFAYCSTHCNTDKKSGHILGAELLCVFTSNLLILAPSWQTWKYKRAWSSQNYLLLLFQSNKIMVTNMKVQKYVLNVHHTFTWGKLCRMKPHVLLLTCHPCNIYG